MYAYTKHKHVQIYNYVVYRHENAQINKHENAHEHEKMYEHTYKTMKTCKYTNTKMYHTNIQTCKNVQIHEKKEISISLSITCKHEKITPPPQTRNKSWSVAIASGGYIHGVYREFIIRI